MKPWEWLQVNELWLEWALAAMEAEGEIEPLLEQRRLREAERRAAIHG